MKAKAKGNPCRGPNKCIRSFDTYLEYVHPRGLHLICYVRSYGDGFKSVMVDVRRREYKEDSVRLSKWPDFKEHRTYQAARRYVALQAAAWQSNPRPKRGDGSPYSRGIL